MSALRNHRRRDRKIRQAALAAGRAEFDEGMRIVAVLLFCRYMRERFIPAKAHREQELLR
jgi:hypothetical protein